MDPTVRLLRLVALLQQRHGWSSHELAERLEVTTRTLRRDVSRLRELGYAVDATPGRGGGYRLWAGSALPPLVLTDEEAIVLAVGLRVAALSGVSGSTETAVSALVKLEGLLPTRLRARVAALGGEVLSLGGGPGEVAVDPSVLALLALACHRGERVALSYRDARGRDTRRDVDAYRIVNAGRRWYLVAHDVRRRAWRTFRIDRVGQAERLGGRAVFDDPPDAAAFVAEGVTTAVYTWVATVRLEMPLAIAQQAVRPTVGQLTRDDDTTTLLRIGADDLDWLARYLVGLTCDLEVLDPPELIDAFRELGRRLSRTGPRLVAGRQGIEP